MATAKQARKVAGKPVKVLKAATGPKREFKAPKEAEKAPSRRQQIRDCIDAHGEDAARKLGLKLKLPASTTDAYIKGWAKIRGTIAAKPKKATATTQGSSEPWYRYPSRAKAEEAKQAIANRAGLFPDVYLIQEEPNGAGTFALVPNSALIAKLGDKCYTPKARAIVASLKPKR
jgi:hypothetical protein